MIYHNGFIVIAQDIIIRCIEISHEEVKSKVEHYMNFDHGVALPKNDQEVLESKDFVGITSSDPII